MVAGIDFGARFAGTTAIAVFGTNRISIHQSAKKEDADAFLAGHLELFPDSAIIGFDAPLSLPGVYSGLKGYSDFQYRKVDRELKAMSPLFLGGLTARAMAMKHRFSRLRFIETYPARQADRLELHALNYKKNDARYKQLVERLSLELKGVEVPTVNTTHQFDALLALLAAVRVQNHCATQLGAHEEGLIYL